MDKQTKAARDLTWPLDFLLKCSVVIGIQRKQGSGFSQEYIFLCMPEVQGYEGTFLDVFFGLLQRAALQPLELLLGRAPVPKPAEVAADIAVDALRAPAGAIVKEGGASGKQIRRSKQQPVAKKQPSHVRSHPANSTCLSQHVPHYMLLLLLVMHVFRG